LHYFVTLKIEERLEKFGVIFDMDGTMIDNMPYHRKAWRELHKRYNVPMAEDFLPRTSGKTNSDIMPMIFGEGLFPERIEKLSREKEMLYRELYRPHMRLVNGLSEMLEALKAENIPMCVGSSAPDENIDMVLDGLNIRHYFTAIIGASQITQGKPNPEVFLKAAAAMNLAPEQCVVIEDAVLGVEAARNAGMAVIAISTIMPPEQLQQADMVIKDFTEVNVYTFENLLN
jgi:beta-phosphoglucomutase family hydrolase